MPRASVIERNSQPDLLMVGSWKDPLGNPWVRFLMMTINIKMIQFEEGIQSGCPLYTHPFLIWDFGIGMLGFNSTH